MLMINIETSPACNLNCIYCYSDAGTPIENPLKLTEYYSVIDQAIELGARVVAIAGVGEPLCDPNFWSIADYIEKKGLWLILFTNNTLVNSKVSTELFGRKITLVSTLNSRNPEVQDYLAGKKGAHQLIYQGLDNMLDAGFASVTPTRLALDLFMMQENYNEIPDLFRYARENNIFPFVCYILKCGRADERSLDITTEQFKEMFYVLLKVDQEEFGYSWVPHPPYAGSQCKNFYYSMLVDIQGNVRPCYGTFINIGSVREKPLSQLWNDPSLLKMRNMKEHIKGKCRECEIVEECYGCRCRTFALTGDAFAEDPTCWY